MKQPGIVHHTQKIFFLFSTLITTTTNFVQQGKVRKNSTIAKTRSGNEHTLLDRIHDAVDDGDLENASSIFDISNLNGSFPKYQFNGTIFFYIKTSLCHNFDGS